MVSLSWKSCPLFLRENDSVVSIASDVQVVESMKTIVYALGKINGSQIDGTIQLLAIAATDTHRDHSTISAAPHSRLMPVRAMMGNANTRLMGSSGLFVEGAMMGRTKRSSPSL